jgi:hypothetical protein
MKYICKRCNFETIHLHNFKIHINRKLKCTNINNVDEELNLLSEGCIPSEKKIEEINKKYICTKCKKEYNSSASAYRHYNNECGKNEKTDELKKRKLVNIVEKENNTMILHQENHIHLTFQNIIVNPFEHETLDHVDKLLMLDSIFNSINDDSALFTKNVFQKIHTELVKSPKNLNMYLSGFHSRSVMFINENAELETECTNNAIFLRVKSIYSKVISLYYDIYKNYPFLYEEIYEKYAFKNMFHFKKTDYKSMYAFLSEALTYFFEQYTNQEKNMEVVKIHNSIRLDLIENRKKTQKLISDFCEK